MPSPATESNIAIFRHFYAKYVAEGARQSKERIRLAFAAVERERFVGRGPWQVAVPGGYISTDSDDPSLVYQDILIGLFADKGINTGIPSLHARCLGEANPQPGDIVLQVGAGTGYYTAILAKLVGLNGFVHAYELEQDLAQRAMVNLKDRKNVTIYSESALTATLPTADIIYVCASVTHPPNVWLDALAIGGRMVLPLEPKERFGCMLLVTRHSQTAYAAGFFASASYIPCEGACDDSASQALTAALESGNQDKVRSLRRNSYPDETAWCVGSDWWLSLADCIY